MGACATARGERPYPDGEQRLPAWSTGCKARGASIGVWSARVWRALIAWPRLPFLCVDQLSEWRRPCRRRDQGQGGTSPIARRRDQHTRDADQPPGRGRQHFGKRDQHDGGTNPIATHADQGHGN